MVDIKAIEVDLPKAGPYSHAVKAGNLLFLAGQVSAPGKTDIEEQTLTAFEKIKTILSAAGTEVKNIVKVTVFLTDISLFKKMNGAYKKFFNDNEVTDNYPARVAVEISALPAPNLLIEIEVIAAL